MKPKAYLIFHLNLAFSSIDAHDWPRVVDKCYWPILNIILEQKIPLGIELSAWTLEKIKTVCPEWVAEFKRLLAEGRCELIGSGYCQIITPLVPYELNIKNQNIGLTVYKDLLNVKPEVALVNEMAFSDSVIDLLAEVGYSAFIMDRDNVALAVGARGELPALGKGAGEATLPILWAESILFQKLQQVCHGDISMDDYLGFVAKKIRQGSELLPIYTSDAETFDFRPGRFKEEKEANPSGEWIKLRATIQKLKDTLGLEFILPSAAVPACAPSFSPSGETLTSAGYPVVVKKQPKYNIARWAVTGRDDVWLNTMCFRIYEKLKQRSPNDSGKWKNLCELWSSDLRTHLTEKRWSETINRIKQTLAIEDIPDRYRINSSVSEINFGDEEEILGHYQRRYTGDGIYVELRSKYVCLVLNLRRGITIEELRFASHGFESCIGKMPHGSSQSICDGFDYYSGGVIIDLPKSLSKTTDLKPVNPSYSLDEKGSLLVKAEIDTPLGKIEKVLKIESLTESLTCSYKFENIKRDVGSVRVGNFTLSPSFSKALESYSFHSGGVSPCVYQVDRSFEQSAAATRYVSSSRGFCSTTGKVRLGFASKSIDFSWDNGECAPLCFLDHSEAKTRLGFSICEYDETSRESERLGELCLKICPGNYSAK